MAGAGPIESEGGTRSDRARIARNWPLYVLSIANIPKWLLAAPMRPVLCQFLPGGRPTGFDPNRAFNLAEALRELIDGYRYSFQLFLDDHSTSILREWIEELRLVGLVNSAYINEHYRPHLSMSVYRDLDEEFARGVARSISNACQAFPLNFSSFGFFGADMKVLFLSPVYSEELRDIHRSLHGEFTARSEQCWPYYLAESWVPHCALLIDTDTNRVLSAAERVLTRQLPDATAKSIGVVGFGVDYELPLLELPQLAESRHSIDPALSSANDPKQSL